MILRDGKVHYFFVNNHLIWFSGWDSMICLLLKIQQNFMCLYLQEEYCFGHILFGIIIIVVVIIINFR